MDAPDIEDAEHRRALRGLARINRLSRCHTDLWPPLRDLARRARRRIRVLDVATGSGDVPIRLARLARRQNIDIEWHVCDISSRAVGDAIANARRAGFQFSGQSCDIVKACLSGPFDVVTSSLFLHHLDPVDVRSAMRVMADAAKHLLLISDLRRTRAGLILAATVPRFVSRSPVVWFDARASVRAAYSLDELRTLAAEAGLVGASVRRAWPQRMLLTWQRAT